ncbi:protein FAM47A-like [Macrobrachium rosenbergii]|uniref:protein FAM47A-like n=1 Tax=Macrobrachium rosenbergii TaxID=79674 RepID=UPI0034D63E28
MSPASYLSGGSDARGTSGHERTTSGASRRQDAKDVGDTLRQEPPKDVGDTLRQEPPKDVGDTLRQEPPKDVGDTLRQEPPKDVGDTLRQEPPKDVGDTLRQEPPSMVLGLILVEAGWTDAGVYLTPAVDRIWVTVPFPATYFENRKLYPSCVAHS